MFAIVAVIGKNLKVRKSDSDWEILQFVLFNQDPDDRLVGGSEYNGLDPVRVETAP